MNILKRNLLFVISLPLVFSCGGNSKPENSLDQASNYKLEIVDSVQVDALAQYMIIADVHKETGELLAIQSSPPKLWILSPEGEIKSEWEKQGDGPDEIGQYLLSAEFYGNDIAMMGMMRLKIFNRNFELVKDMKPHYNQGGMIYMGFNHLIEFGSQGAEQLVTFFGGPQTDIPALNKEYYDEYNIVDVVNPNSELSLGEGIKSGFLPIGKLEPDSRYRNDRAYYFMKPEFDVKESKLFYSLKDDTTLFVRNLPMGELERSYTIPFDEFILFEGYSLGKEGIAEQSVPRDWAGKIEKVFHIDNKEVLIYTSGMKLSKVQELDPESPDFREKTKRVNYTKYLIVDDGKRLNLNLQLPNKVSSFDMADDFGFIWAHQDLSQLEEEPDLITFYKLKIVPDEN